MDAEQTKEAYGEAGGFAEEAKPFSLQGLINSHVAKLGKEKSERTTWRASSLGKCPRAAFYKRLGVEETSPLDERTQRVFKVGDIFHEWIQDIANDEGYALAIEYELEDKKLDLEGRCDLIVHADKKRILVDIKTINSRAFWHLEKSGKTVQEKYPQYVRQLGAYMLMLKKNGEPVDEGRVLLVSKDDLMLKEVTYYLTTELEQAVTEELEMLNKHWAEKTLPPCRCMELYIGKDGKSSGPRYCNYKTEGKNQCCDESLAKGKL